MLLLDLKVHLVEGTNPLVDHESSKDKAVDGVVNLGEGLEGYSSFAWIASLLKLIFIQGPKHLKVGLQLYWNIQKLRV
jgi:hypothetical protein